MTRHPHLVVAALALAACGPADAPRRVATEDSVADAPRPERPGRARPPDAPQQAAVAQPDPQLTEVSGALAWADRLLRDGPGADIPAAAARATRMLESDVWVERVAGAQVLASLGPPGRAVLLAFVRDRPRDAAGREEAFDAVLALADVPADIWISAFADTESGRSSAFDRLAIHGTADPAVAAAALDALVDGNRVYDEAVDAFARGVTTPADVLLRRADDAGDDAVIRLADVLVRRGEGLAQPLVSRLSTIVREHPSECAAALRLLFASTPDVAWNLALETARSPGIGLSGAERLLAIAAAADSGGARVHALAAIGLEANPSCFRDAIAGLAGEVPALRSLAVSTVTTGIGAAVPDRVLAGAHDADADRLVWDLLQDADWSVRGRTEDAVVDAIDAGRAPDWSQITPSMVTNVECARAVRRWLVAQGKLIGVEWRAVVEADGLPCSSPASMDGALFSALRLATWRTPPHQVDAWLAEDPYRGMAAALTSGDDGIRCLERWAATASGWDVEQLCDAIQTAGADGEATRHLLGALLVHAKPSVRASAAWVCHRLSVVPDDAVARVDAMLRDPSTDVRSNGIWLLATAAPQMAPGDVRKRLQAALADRSADVVEVAAWAVGELGQETFVPDLALRARFGDSSGAWALGRLGIPGICALAEALRNASRTAASRCANCAIGGLYDRASAGADVTLDDAAAAAVRTLLAMAGDPFPAAVRAEVSSYRIAALLTIRLPADAAAAASWAESGETDALVRAIGERMTGRPGPRDARHRSAAPAGSSGPAGSEAPDGAAPR